MILKIYNSGVEHIFGCVAFHPYYKKDILSPPKYRMEQLVELDGKIVYCTHLRKVDPLLRPVICRFCSSYIIVALAEYQFKDLNFRMVII